MHCGDCNKTDGNVYTSFPPKVKCAITGEYHFYSDWCNIEYAPVIHGHWIDVSEKYDVGMDLRCSICKNMADSFVGGTENWWSSFEPKYCPTCGAKMDEVEETV